MDTKATLTHALSTALADAFQAGIKARDLTPDAAFAKVRADWIKDNLGAYVGPLLSQLAPTPPAGLFGDLWHYRPDTRVIADQNGLPVAKDIGPDDARVILSMQRGLQRIAAPCHGSSDRADAFNECAAVARSALDGNETVGLEAEDLVTVEGERVHDVIVRLLAYEADAFQTGAAVDYQDVTNFFAETRVDLAAALRRGRGPMDLSLATATRDLVGCLDEALTTHIYDEDNGDEIPEDCSYTAAINAGRAALVGTQIKVRLLIEGGGIVETTTSQPVTGLILETVDRDTDGIERDRLMMLDQGADYVLTDRFQPVYVREHEPDGVTTKVLIDAQDERFDADFSED